MSAMETERTNCPGFCKYDWTINNARVKGIDVHPSMPLAVVTLHSGLTQIIDLNTRQPVNSYPPGAGAHPVRSGAFHPTLPVIATCSDDFVCRLYDYDNLKATTPFAELHGHDDYVRTVRFHPTAPWLLSSSDDQSVRLWPVSAALESRGNATNLASPALYRNSTIVGKHDHYVMCADFNREGTLVISASLDNTVKVTNVSAIVGKSPVSLTVTSTLVARGHTHGVNFAQFHPTRADTFISASDDKTLRVWKFDASGATLVHTLFGHVSNVSWAAFLTPDLVVSGSEDGTLRVFDIELGQLVQTVRTERSLTPYPSRYWIVRPLRALDKSDQTRTLPTNATILAGHDSGLTSLTFDLRESALPAQPEIPSSFMRTLFFDGDEKIDRHDIVSSILVCYATICAVVITGVELRQLRWYGVLSAVTLLPCFVPHIMRVAVSSNHATCCYCRIPAVIRTSPMVKVWCAEALLMFVRAFFALIAWCAGNRAADPRTAHSVAWEVLLFIAALEVVAGWVHVWRGKKVAKVVTHLTWRSDWLRDTEREGKKRLSKESASIVDVADEAVALDVTERVSLLSSN